MGTDVDKILDFVENARSLTDTCGVITEFQTLVESLGFRHFILTGLPWHGGPPVGLVVGSNWPKEWLDQYSSKGYFEHDPVAIAALINHAPFTWKSARDRYGSSAIAIEIAQASASFGLADGIAFPFLDRINRRAIASLSAEHQLDLPAYLVVILQGVVTMVYDKLRELEGNRADILTPLSVREANIVRWFSKGKSGWEISQIVGISEGTVKFHLNRAKAKLQTSTIAETVAVAIYFRQI